MRERNVIMIKRAKATHIAHILTEFIAPYAFSRVALSETWVYHDAAKRNGRSYAT